MRSGVQMIKTPMSEATEATLIIDVSGSGKESVPALGDDESYTLDVDEHHISLRAESDIGALRGMETLLQLVQPENNGFAFPVIHIEDAPRFHWRGLLLDPGRHFLPVPVIIRTLDAMATVKLNVLHWHLTEDQGFRIESKVYPKLHGLGSDGQFYTQQQVREIVQNAAARGIRIVPEFDIPGHSTTWLIGYPNLASAPGPYSIQHTFGVKDAALDPTRETTYKFLDAFLGEMARLFPDAYVHIGGDETNGKQWRSNPRIKAFMDAHGMKTTKELQAYFNLRVQKILVKYHKQMVGWEEVLNPSLSADVVIQSWLGSESLVEAAKNGHRGILSGPYYLDSMDSAGTSFLADPIPDGAKLTPEQTKLILGGEVCMWGEHVTAGTIDSRIWPRSAAIAERLWSRADDHDVNDMYRRLGVMSLRLESEGTRHISGPEAGLRQLAGTEQDQALTVFASTLQPLEIGQRSKQQHTTQLTPMDRLVDWLRPDPPLQHQLELLVDGALRGDASDTQQLEAIFRSWVDAAPQLDQLAAHSPLLQEVTQRRVEWQQLGAMGVEATVYLRSGKMPPPGWKEAQLAVLHEAAQPGELADFVILKPLEKLVVATTVNASDIKKPLHR